MSSNLPEASQNVSWREQRRAARYGSRGAPWMGGVILILLGIIFLLQNMGASIFTNWWALFILLPAVGSFSAAWNSYDRSGGQITGATIGSFIAGVVFTALTFALLFNFGLNLIGPAVLILIGIGILLPALLRTGT